MSDAPQTQTPQTENTKPQGPQAQPGAQPQGGEAQPQQAPQQGQPAQPQGQQQPKQGGGQGAQIGVIGMGVMGTNLARNMARHGYRVAIWNLEPQRTMEVAQKYQSEGAFVPSAELKDFVASLERPRNIMMMITAGKPVDIVIEELLPLVEPGDVIIDGGNSLFTDTIRREKYLADKQINFVGCGISGGEVGALEGPSIMPGGSKDAYASVGPILEAISAHVDGEPCCTHVGPDGAGHFVKMVHNGIEYADMQLIAEAYDLLKAAGLEDARIADVFRQWNTGDLDSYLIEITSKVLEKQDPRSGKPLVEVILDEAEQKGTGSWTVSSACDLGSPVNVIAEAVFARSTSGHGDLRQAARQTLAGPDRQIPAGENLDQLINDIQTALWAAKVVAYAQGLDEIRTGSKTYDWDVNMAEIAKIWRSGCVIRARLLERIRAEYASENPVSLVTASNVAADMAKAQDAWRRVIQAAVAAGVPTPGFSAALAYYDTIRAERLPASLVQGLRDYFGAHTYKRVDGEGTFHTDWSGDGQEHQMPEPQTDKHAAMAGPAKQSHDNQTGR